MNNYSYKIIHKNINADQYINYIIQIDKLDDDTNQVMIYHTPFFESEKSEEELNEIVTSFYENNWEPKNLIDLSTLELFNSLNKDIEVSLPSFEVDQYGHPIENIGE